jgi:hypothetical protein
VHATANYKATIDPSATINDLAASQMTAEGWFKITNTGVTQWLMVKGLYSANGWLFRVESTGVLTAKIWLTTGNIQESSVTRVDDNVWRHYKFTYDDLGDRKIRIYANSILIATSSAAAYPIASDAAVVGTIGRGTSGLTGAHGWVRWSNAIRGEEPITRKSPPPIDARTMGQWPVNEGSGATLTDVSGNANHGAMTGTFAWARE